MTDIFISDLHLSEEQPAISEGFKQFLSSGLRDAERLFILGDFFELWIGDDYRTDFHNDIISALTAVQIPKFVMHGNRDFLLGEQFCQEIGAELLKDPTVIEIEGQKVLLMHGDSLCTDDTAYMQVRGILRSEAFIADFLTKTPEERLAFAQNARQESQAHTSEAAMEIMDVNQAEVVSAMEEAGVNVLIHGHTHRPGSHQIALPTGIGRRIVLGDWTAEAGWKIVATNGELTLSEFQY